MFGFKSFPLSGPNARTIYLYSILVGLLSGFVALLFYWAVHYLWQLSFGLGSGLEQVFVKTLTLSPVWPHGVYPALLLCFLPALGGLCSGYVSYKFAPETRSSGTDVFLSAFHHKAGVLRKRTTPVKLITSILTLGTGGSGGKEGPMMLIGAGLGSLFSQVAKLGARARRTLFLAGAAGGLGAIFRSPLGGAITAVEVLYKEDFESDALIPCIISSVTAYTVFGAFTGYSHMLKFKSTPFHSPSELILYVVLGVVCTGFAYLFIKFYHATETFLVKAGWRRFWFIPAVGGLLVGLVALVRPEVLGPGFDIIQHAIDGHYSSDWTNACWALLILGVCKMLATTFTVASGGSAGVMIPSLYMGAMLGGVVGIAGQHFFPTLVPQVAPFVVVGMAACFSAVTKASLGGLVMVVEITGGYELLPPLMVVTVISLIGSGKWSIYKNQVLNKFYSKAHLWDLNPSLLNAITVDEAFPILNIEAIVDENTPLDRLTEISHRTHHGEFLVQDGQSFLLGVVDLFDFNLEHQSEASLANAQVAKNFMKAATASLTLSDSLYKAVEIMTSNRQGIIPVVRPERSRLALLGYITRQDILKFYKNSRQTTRR